MHEDAIGALQALSRAFTPTAWATPADLAGLRDALAVSLTTGAPFTGTFRYPPVDVGAVEALAGSVRAASTGLDLRLRDLVLAEVDDIVTTTRVIASRDDAALASLENQPARLPTPEVVDAARTLAASGAPPLAEPCQVDAAAMTSAVKTALRRYCITGWRVETRRNMSARMSVIGTQRQVRVRADLAVSPGERDRLLAHEVGGHVLRWVNAREQPEPLAAIPLGETIATEEGNAASVEEEIGVSGEAHLRTYAVRVLGVDAGRTRGLIDLARHLYTWLSPTDAAELALRLRRGFINPDAAGVRTKDHGYLSGLLALRRLRVDSPDDVALLRVTKWPLEWLPLMRDLRDAGRLREPRLVADRERILAAS